MSAADERFVRAALRVESALIAESITHSRPQVITRPSAGFKLRIASAESTLKGLGICSGRHEATGERSSQRLECSPQRASISSSVSRSEERRVGKECRSRCATDHYK